MTDDVFRVYEPGECGRDGYPLAWHALPNETVLVGDLARAALELGGMGRRAVGVKHLVRALADHRCERCQHPYAPLRGVPRRWSRCDARCTHGGPVRVWMDEMEAWAHPVGVGPRTYPNHGRVEAEWRILTVHHLLRGADGKRDLRWWNLASLCQRCHLSIQNRVDMAQVFPHEHTEWFKPHAAGWYATAYLGLDLSRGETLARLDELLSLERVA